MGNLGERSNLNANVVWVRLCSGADRAEAELGERLPPVIVRYFGGAGQLDGNNHSKPDAENETELHGRAFGTDP